MRRTDAWNDAYCTETEQFAQHGESDWETIHRIFADTRLPRCAGSYRRQKRRGFFSAQIAYRYRGYQLFRLCLRLQPLKMGIL